MPAIQLENVMKWYWAGRSRRERHKEIAVSEINLTIEQGEFLFVIGSAGAGKSTLLSLICGETKPAEGTVLVGGKDVTRRMFQHHTAERNRLFGVIKRDGSLDHKVTVWNNLMRAARTGRRRMEKEESIQARAQKALGIVGMAQSGPKYPGELTRGECRRVELARALVNSPPILVLDELTANLDDDSIWDMLHLLREVNMRGTTVIMATHSSRCVNLMRQRVITLVDGQIVGDVQKGRYGIVN